MAIETLDDIVSELMDQLGVYDVGWSVCQDTTADARECQCRCCQEASLKARIRAAAEIERKLYP